MAKITYGPAISEARGKIGDVVFTRTRGGATAKALKLGPLAVRASNWFSGAIPPTTIPGQLNQDLYLNTANGNVYQLLNGAWTLIANINGAAGPPGSNGPPGARGSWWYAGTTTPPTISGQEDTDLYLRTTTGDVYQLIGGTWSPIANITGPQGPAGSGHSAAYTETDLTWGASATVCSLTNAFPANQTFTAFKRIRIRYTTRLVSPNTFHNLLITKGSNIAYVLGGSASVTAQPAWVQYAYPTNHFDTKVGNTPGISVYGWNYFELIIDVAAASSNVLSLVANGLLYYAFAFDTNIDMTTGNFTIYAWQGQAGGPPNPGDSTNHVDHATVETW